MPDKAEAARDAAYGLVPRVKITDLLLEVDAWTGFSACFTHQRNGRSADDRNVLLAAILADGINLGLTRMAETCRGVSLRQLAWVHDWHVREETYTAALTRLIEAHRALPIARLWGDGTTSSSDGQYFQAGSQGAGIGDINARHGNEPGVAFYTHISDQFSPFHTKVIAATASEAPHVLDGLLYHQTGLQISEHYTDTGGATDHVFGLCPFFGFRFAPRLRDIKDRRLYLLPGMTVDPVLEPLVGGTLDIAHVEANWNDLLRLGTSIHAGTTTASAMLRRLSAFPRQNGLAIALREIGRLERTLFTLDWIRNIDLRRRAHAGLNKGEARNALARALFFNRLGELRDRQFENQVFRASGLNPAGRGHHSMEFALPCRSVREPRSARGALGAGNQETHGSARMGAYQPDRRLYLERSAATGPWRTSASAAIAITPGRLVPFPFTSSVRKMHFRVRTPVATQHHSEGQPPLRLEPGSRPITASRRERLGSRN